MGKLNVWAPSARKAVLKIQSRDVPFSPRERGWWQVESDLIAAGQDYRLVLDDHPPIPDPRSAWQPQGTDGPSRFLDHAHFRWTDANWQPRPLTAGLVYELHVGTFSREGTFAGIERHLDHLDRFGVTHVELMPVNCFPGTRGWGYDGVDLYAPQHAYGGPGRPQAPGRRLPRARARGDPRRGLQPPRPGRQLPGPVRSVLHRPLPNAVGRGRQLRRPGQRRGAPLLLRQRADVAARLPLRRAAPRRRARHRTTFRRGHFLEQLAAEVRAARRRARPLAGPDRGERPERPAHRPAAARSAGTVSTRSGATTSITRCTRC